MSHYGDSVGEDAGVGVATGTGDGDVSEMTLGGCARARLTSRVVEGVVANATIAARTSTSKIQVGALLPADGAGGCGCGRDVLIRVVIRGWCGRFLPESSLWESSCGSGAKLNRWRR
jgi:hypothetical protein